MPSGSHTILGFFVPNITAVKQSDGNTHIGGIKCNGCEKIAIFDQYLALSRKWYKNEMWNANRKPYPNFKMVPFSLTSSDLKPRFPQGHTVIWQWISQKWYEIHSFKGVISTSSDLVKYLMTRSLTWSLSTIAELLVKSRRLWYWFDDDNNTDSNNSVSVYGEVILSCNDWLDVLPLCVYCTKEHL